MITISLATVGAIIGGTLLYEGLTERNGLEDSALQATIGVVCLAVSLLLFAIRWIT